MSCFPRNHNTYMIWAETKYPQDDQKSEIAAVLSTELTLQYRGGELTW